MNAGKSLVKNDSYSWQELATNPDNSFASLCVNAQGTLYAAQNSNGSQGDLVQWDPATSTWKSLGQSFNNTINCICADTKGNIYVAGSFTDSQACCYIARYSPSTQSWINFSNPAIKYPINYICVDSAGTVYVTGNFRSLNGNCYVASYNVSTGWKELSGGNFINNSVVEICYGAGNLYALENIAIQDGPLTCFLKVWNKNTKTWTMPSGSNMNPATQALYYNDGSVYILNSDSTVSSYDSSSSSWGKTSAIPFDMINAVLFFDGPLLFVAGYILDGENYQSVLASYDFGTTQWTPIQSSSLNSATCISTACASSDSIYLGGAFPFVLQGNLS